MISRKVLGVLMTGVMGCCLFAGCAGTKPGKGYSGNIPDEIEQLMNKKYKTAVVAVGTATGPKENIAEEKAVAAGRAEIARQFKAQIDALQKMYEESVNDKSLEEYKQAIEIFASMEITGSVIAKTMIRKEGKNGFSAKVLVVLSAENMKAMMDEKLAQITSFKASKAYKELEDRVAKEKEAQKEEQQ
jgi:hypothetical protein